MDDRTGQMIKGYELRERIGVGGFGAVYRAYQPLIDREVAVKAILPEYANHPDFIRRFETEARLIAHLEHPYIVPLFDFWRDPEGAYLVMRYLRGGSLAQFLRHQPLELEATAQMLDQITSALSVAHRSEVVHRDIKPANILLDEAGNFYLTDFGLATLTGSDQDDGVVYGSLAYIAPEQLQEQSPTTRSDIYSLGILLYEVLTGAHPFSDLSMSELISRQLIAPLPDLQLTRASLPDSLNHIIQAATHKDPAARYTDVREMAFAFRQAITGEKPHEKPVEVHLTASDNPYKGLHPFEEADAADFFGRDALVEQILARLQEPVPYHQFLAVIGPSGSGKSSVIYAGLLPRLRRGKIPGSESWFMIDMVPGESPLRNLEAALLSVAITPPPNLHETLQTSPQGLVQAATDILAQSAANSTMLLIIDQFEEVFTLAKDEAQIIHFLDMLYTTANATDSPLWILVALRADFYDRPLLYGDFAALVQSRTQTVIPLTAEELEHAITGPAERIGMQVEADLVAQIIMDVRQEPGALPLLQYALSEVFERREQNLLTLDAYQASGGVLGALARRADEVFDGFDEEARIAARQLSLRLVTLGEGSEDTRRRARISELVSVVSNPAAMQHVLEAFGQYRLLTFDHERNTRESTVEVAHEALLRTWTRLRTWLDENRDAIRMQRLLAAAVAEWHSNGRLTGFLLHGGRLAQFEEWASQTTLALTPQERDFLTASLAERARQDAEDSARRAHERALEHRARQRLQVIVGVLLVAIGIGIVMTLVILNQTQIAQRERDNAETQAVIAQEERDNAHSAHATSDANLAIAEREADVSRSLALANAAEALLRGDEPHPDIALALAVEAVSIPDPPPEASLTLANAASLSQIRQRYVEAANVKGVAISPDGQTVLLALVDGTLTLRDIASGETLRTFTGHTDSVYTVVFGADGQTALSGSRDGVLILWEVATGEVLRQFEAGHTDAVRRVAFSPDGQTAVSASEDGTLILWNLVTGERVYQLEGHTDEVHDVSFSPDGQTALSASLDQSAILWDLTTGEIRHHFTGFAYPCKAVAYHPDGRLVLLTTDRDLYLVDLDTYETLRTFTGHTSTINRAIFNPDGSAVLSVTGSVEFYLWDTTTGDLLQQFAGHRGPIDDLALLPNGRRVITGGADRSAILWDIANDDIRHSLTDHTRSVRSVAFSPDGRTFMSASKDETAILWDAETGEVLRVFAGQHTDGLWGVAIAPDGETALTCSSDRTLVLWDIATGEPLRTLTGHTGNVSKVAYSPDSLTAVSAAGDRTLILWDIATGEPLRTFTGHTDEVRDVAFSPDGRTILSASLDGLVILWDAETGDMIRRLEGHTSEVLGVAFSPDGHTALSGSGDNTLILWEIETGQLLRRYRGHTGAVLGGVAFSPDGRLAVSGSTDTTVILWNVDTGEPLRRYRGHQELISDVAFSPDGNSAVSVSSDSTVILWDVASFADGPVTWIMQNRALAELTCDQRETYHIEPLCEQ